MNNTNTSTVSGTVGRLIVAFKKHAAGHLAVMMAEQENSVAEAKNGIYETFVSHGVELTEAQSRFLNDKPADNLEEAQNQEREGGQEVKSACEAMQELGLPVLEQLMW